MSGVGEGAGSASAPERVLWRVWDDVRQGAERFPLAAEPPPSRAGQFAQGLSLPFHVVRTLLAQPETRRRYLGVCALQAVCVLGLGLLFTALSGDAVKRVGVEADQRLERARAEREVEEEYRAEVLGAASEVVGVFGDKEARAKFKQNVREAELKRQEARQDARRGAAHWVVFWAALLSWLNVAQWIVTALGRDFHTALSREASLLTRVEPEDEPLEPRVRLNVGWLRTKLQRRWRGWWVFALGVPVLWVASRVLPGSSMWFTLFASLWGAWWFMVFTAGKSAHAWKEEQAREPWFLRGWLRAFQGVPVLGRYGEFWKRRTASVFSPAARVERQPWRLAGLAVARALAVLPVVKCFLRPVIPVAAAHLLLAERPATEAERAPSPLVAG